MRSRRPIYLPRKLFFLPCEHVLEIYNVSRITCSNTRIWGGNVGVGSMPGFPTRGNEMDLLLANWARAVASSSASSSEPANNGGTTVGCVCNLPTSPDRCIASAFLPSARKESLGLGLSSKVNAGGSPTAFLQITYVYCIVSGVPPPRFALLVCRMLRGLGHWGREQEQEQDHRNSRTEKPTCDDFSLLEKVR